MEEKEITTLEADKALLEGLLHYHERMTLPIRNINKDPSIDIGIDVYARALKAAIALMDEKIKQKERER